jgi:hypothetical protein
VGEVEQVLIGLFHDGWWVLEVGLKNGLERLLGLQASSTLA